MSKIWELALVDMDLRAAAPWMCPRTVEEEKKSHLSCAVVRGLWVSYPGMDDLSRR